MEARAAVDETEFCHSAAPPSPFIWRFNTDGEGVSALSRQRLGANSNVYYLHGTWMTASFSTVAGAKLAGSAVMFAGALSPSLLKHLLKGEGGLQQNDGEAPMARSLSPVCTSLGTAGIWTAGWTGMSSSVGEAGILLHPPLHLACVSIGVERGCL